MSISKSKVKAGGYQLYPTNFSILLESNYPFKIYNSARGIFPAIPVPPDTTNEPVAVLVLLVVPEITTVPVCARLLDFVGAARMLQALKPGPNAPGQSGGLLRLLFMRAARGDAALPRAARANRPRAQRRC